MNAGKSALALQTDFNLRAVGRTGLLLTRLDRGGEVISSRIGLSAPAHSFGPDTDLFTMVSEFYGVASAKPAPDYVIVDEAQFLSPIQVDDLCRVVDELRIDVHTFGISTDFRSQLFPGSARLIEMADRCEEIQLQAYCWCGDRARMNVRVVGDQVVTDGPQVMVGDVVGEVRYTLLCRKHFMSGALA